MTLAEPDLLQRGGLTLDVAGARATISLSRPDSLNAQTPDTWAALAAIGESLGEEVRVVVVRGEGRSFSAGLDRSLFTPTPERPGIAALGTVPEDEADLTIAGYQAGFSWLRDPARVTVAAVQGHAIGGGFQLALACDLRVVADDVQFCMAEPKLGIVPDLGGTYPLVRAVGYARAVEICLTGRRVGATEAVELGLALRAVPAAELDAAVDELATALVSAPPKAAAATLALLSGVADGLDPASALAAERAAQVRRLRSLAAGTG
ncbi:enoyl-CoA hydratase/isomerase family protein [Pseudonocardia sp. KRD-184]|uniref:Enoyl-CoA hydratase/isomerase family protein n=1 Tax=Pseudonocardia oceani TaxID=2792013 RepID=A0ABS6UIT3_9PSEU|nr:enoyl-CoA hydratase/isomerase family protein [Pseudonocardia oceani]MBW0098622.1 enoyl-CoA hydratase/isomerase family protein [Pseudonocardia oceani]MBW0111135.1 enoyl-CoA hydratase/isomerase family protein [Pseudonocardia oceani]MBW0123744.1 enoyl-CoA hydratase/isomerase family protein [Pseudonocardia oceani]MBW0132144.1 enoyl-CoA hydratase/isomerase family protein [Pseudonocardia oceani]